ncbi:hypothetical protein J3A74_002673 [Rhodococcus sp. PvP104]|nr:hypothetical protein [Rhodococcus sp. PvP104]
MTDTSAVNDWTALVRRELPQGVTVRKVGWAALRACVGLLVVSFAVAAALLLAVLVVVGSVVRNTGPIVLNGVECDARKLRYRRGIGHAGFSTLGKACTWSWHFVVGGKA